MQLARRLTNVVISRPAGSPCRKDRPRWGHDRAAGVPAIAEHRRVDG